MKKRARYLEDLAVFGLTEKQFIKRSDLVKVFIIFETPSLARYKSLTLSERQKKFKEFSAELHQRLIKCYHISRRLDFPAKDGAVLQFTGFVPAAEVPQIVAEKGVRNVFIAKIGQQKKKQRSAFRLYSVSVYSEMWLEGVSKPTRFEEEIFLIAATTRNQAIRKIKKELELREPPFIDPVYDHKYRICEWRIKDIQIIDFTSAAVFSDHALSVAKRYHKKPIKRLFNESFK